ncbi:MAG: HAMP domain-containing protein [Candidatus Omnitrophica bacterium]|nr:HAMP domain-containing protein [Candidatus Omnitrophota bacterium]
MFYKSIRFKMTIAYMAILALTLSIFSAVLFHYVGRSLHENMDTLLRSKAEGIVHAIGTYWEAERLGPNRYGARIDESQGSINFATIAQRWVQEKSKDPKLLDIIVQIYDPNGTVVASSKNTQGIASISEESFMTVLDGKSLFSTLSPSFPTTKVIKFRIFVTPAIQNNQVEYVVQVASPLTSIQTTLDTLRLAIVILFPVTVLLTGIMGTLLATMTLRPVNTIISTIHTITAENMKLKLKLPGTRDEIDRLADTFNDMLARLDYAFTSQRRLFEDLSHDLKTPLTILKGEFEVVLKKMRSQEEYETILKSSLEEVNKIIHLADNLLMLASIEARKIIQERREIDLNLLVQGTVNRVKKLAEAKNVELSLVQNAGMTIKGDEQQLKQLFVNLLDNAIKYTGSGGRVTITIGRTSGSASVTITDNGIGMSKDQADHIFDRFYRIDKSRTEQGFGLGLSIVKSVIDSHSGAIKVDSAPSRGTTFTVLLPIL